jgi:hypothetical protein
MPEYIAAIIIVTEYSLRIVWSATPLLQSEVVPVHAIKVCESVKAKLHSFLNSALGVGECSASRLCYFTAGKEPLCTHLIENLSALEPVWNIWKEKNSCFCWKSNPV